MRMMYCLLLILVGLILVFYSFISNYLFEHRVDSLITTYEKEVDETDAASIEQMLQEAKEYNKNLFENPVKSLNDPFSMQSDSDNENYYEILNLDGNGLMGFIEIPSINIKLPVYHGTTDQVLEKGVGHLIGSSFPVGGENTHAVLTGHTGMRNAKMFTDLNEVKEGDLFFITILNEKLAYKVTDRNVVLPEDVSHLQIQEGKDLVTLITCTPYGVNSHRLLVTGERTKYSEEAYQAESEKNNNDSTWWNTFQDAVLLGILISVILYLIAKIQKKRRQIKRHKLVNRYYGKIKK